MSAALKLDRNEKKAVVAPDRGPLLSPGVVFDRYFAAGWPKVKDGARFVRRHLPDSIKVQVSKREIGFYARDVEAHLESQRG